MVQKEQDLFVDHFEQIMDISLSKELNLDKTVDKYTRKKAQLEAKQI